MSTQHRTLCVPRKAESFLSDVSLTSIFVRMHIKENPPGDLAGSEDLEHERQAVRDQLLRVLVLLDAAEVFEQALDQRPAVLDEAGSQGLQPGVQRPGNAWEQQAHRQ